MKAITDELDLAQKPVDNDDPIVHVITQFGDDYKEISVALKIHDSPLTFSDFYEKLVDHERSLQATNPTPLVTIVNNTQRQGSRPFSRPSLAAQNTNRPNSFGLRNTPSHNYNSGPSVPHKVDTRIIIKLTEIIFFCHFCNIPGHDTKACGS
ncbi:hypothetical protein HanPI659440_Chr15g0610961 [Helianthus annuus]|nr:hypothetical protein HanHA300_Chr15g0581681 [Helianthus annuus]KAJ0474587.1 hypothetical protein HanHA89_Chr15g0631401 [Helianthus annuus]KAJ0650144.1 hypothetical protein HanLR1_Chr15g0592321 [Helianthus annuus]KAJ0653916.1 hypothetical protein HanOQP8_Chr15g0588971 [Helianthus annuus]KAJ0694625.1 hypothetical protein HanPI659440_Chr15g0610961 [Helianthus annuus]